MDRILCKIFGCKIEEFHQPGCSRCGAWLYDCTFVGRERSWLSLWYNFTWWLRCNRDWFYHKCAVCKKPMCFTKKDCCSEECYDLWIPF